MNFEPQDLSENPTAGSVSRLIGEALMLRLSEDLGGKVLYIPLKAGENSPITASIGIEAAQKISDVYGGLRFEVPTVLGRDATIVRLYNSGMSVTSIAHQMRISRSTIHRVIDRCLKSSQGDLFSGLS